jgi:hypothetical protein
VVRRSINDLLYQPRTIDDECGAVGGMRIGRGTEVFGENLPHCPPQISHDVTRERTRAAASIRSDS